MDISVVEADFAFQIDVDCPCKDRDYEGKDVVAAIGALYLDIHLLQSRFQDFGKPISDMIADSAVAGSLVLGSEFNSWSVVIS